MWCCSHTLALKRHFCVDTWLADVTWVSKREMEAWDNYVATSFGGAYMSQEGSVSQIIDPEARSR